MTDAAVDESELRPTRVGRGATATGGPEGFVGAAASSLPLVVDDRCELDGPVAKLRFGHPPEIRIEPAAPVRLGHTLIRLFTMLEAQASVVII